MPVLLEPPRRLHDLQSYKGLTNDVLTERIQAVRAAMGRRLLILGHHYQQDEVIALADLRGDSYQLSATAAAQEECRAIAFCGVHFMAETADVLANRPEQVARRGGERVAVVLPDMKAGCSMADMADIEQVEDCWEQLAEVIDADDVMPVTYVNSAASLKAFCGRHGGIVCTSSNARAVLEWSFQRRRRVLFFPDQHLGRNTALKMDIPLDQMPVWDPRQRELGRELPRCHCQQPRALVERSLQRASDVPAAARRPIPREVSRHQNPRPSGVHDGSRPAGRRDRLHEPHYPGGPAGPAGQPVGDWHGDCTSCNG